MNYKTLHNQLIKVIFAILLTLIIGYILRLLFNQILLEDEASVGWFFGVFGTFYTLITAFILVTVWTQYTSFEKLLAVEAKNISAIWNLTDYLNDKKVSQKMKGVLLKYIDSTVDKEMQEHTRGNKVDHPSRELVSILEVIDKINFDDKRDASIFQSIINAYEELSTSRAERIEHSVTRIPPILKLFFLLVSVLFVVIYMVHGFNNLYLYLFTLAVLTFIVKFSYIIITDLDNPFKGIWNISLESFINCRNFISSREHSH